MIGLQLRFDDELDHLIRDGVITVDGVKAGCWGGKPSSKETDKK